MDQNANYSSSTTNYKPPKPNRFTANITKNRTIIKTISAGMNTNKKINQTLKCSQEIKR